MSTYAEAQTYVGTNESSGHFQFDVLRLEGCKPESKVLEIGCGCLHAAVPLVKYLDIGNYVGIEPNQWLIQSTPDTVQKLMRERRAKFLSVIDFDATDMGEKFDFILSHSVLSHCADHQADQFLSNSAAVLAPKGKIVATIRLSEGNLFGSPGHPERQDSMDTQWQYPGVSWFTLESISRKAYRCGLLTMLRPQYTQRLITIRPEEVHDWIVFCHSNP